MAVFDLNSHHHYRVRSVSLPTRSHPSTTRIDQVVNKLKTWDEASSASYKADQICNSLLGLRELHQGIEELLALPLTQQAIAQRKLENRVNELVDESVRYIDVCSNTRDIVMQIREAIRGLQSSLRRNKLGELSIGSDVAAFMCSRKNLHKEISRSLSKLKHIDNTTVPVLISNSDDHHFTAVIKGLTEASLSTISTFSSLLSFLCVPVMKSKPTSWSLVSKLMHKGVIANQEGQRNNYLNELESVDVALGDLQLHASSKGAAGGKERIESAQRRLEALETILESVENRLELLFRHLVRTRVSFLNILSQ